MNFYYNNLFSPSKLKSLFKIQNITPKYSLGQNFLIDRNIVGKIIDAAQPSKNDKVIEVGAGLGVLTVPLGQAARQVIAYEIDKRLIPLLSETVSDFDNVEIVNEDILLKLKTQSSKLKTTTQTCLIGSPPKRRNSKFSINSGEYKVIGNLPYYITSRILRHFLSVEHKPQSMIITIQKEVAERICAKPPQMSLLSVSVQFYGRPQIMAQVSKNCFWPRPKVDSAIVRIDINGAEFFQEHHFFSLVKAGFSSKRKMLINNLLKKLGGEKRQWEEIFCQIGLNPQARAQELGVEEWKDLALISKNIVLIF
ncbi:MAG: 16S rRNA (adenine(1518)-N(6)/adenine(1519)-N(6))-dimethyltransferase RsmA [Candidatus Jacksonbacteria bacterium]